MADAPSASFMGVPMKHISLVTLTFQNSALILIMHYSRIMPMAGTRRYFTSTAVFLNEILKLAVSLTIAMYDISRTLPPSTPATVLFEQLYMSVFSGDGWKLAIPATLYTLQNSLQYIAILTTALFSVTMLGRTLSSKKWTALVLLTIGVTIVQLPTNDPDAYSPIQDAQSRFYFPRSFHELGTLGNGAVEVARELTKRGMDGVTEGLQKRSATYEGIQDDLGLTRPVMNYSIGLSAVLIAAVISGLTGVYFEKVLKESSSTHVSVWTRNVQLSFYSLFPALIVGVIFKDVAMCINYADNIAKNFATSISIILSFVFSLWFFDFQVTLNFILGTAIVTSATYLYLPPSQERPKTILNYTSLDPRSARWAFARAPRQPFGTRDPPISNCHGPFPDRSPRSIQRLPTRNPARLSLAPRNIYPQQERATGPRLLSDVDNHFNVARNLREDVSFGQPSGMDALQEQSPYTKLTNDMMFNAASSRQTMSLMGTREDINRSERLNRLQMRKPVSRLESDVFDRQDFQRTSRMSPDRTDYFQEVQPSRTARMQVQGQPITPPFNLNGFSVTPNFQPNDSSSSPLPTQISSPSIRVNLRRSTHHPTSLSQLQDDGSRLGQNLLSVKTPQSKAISPPHRSAPYASASTNRPPIAHGIQLVSPHELPDRFQQVFPYELLNAVQSKCFEPIYKSDDNVVVSAPTGSGKTALLELAICRAVEGYGSGQFKIVYQAPTKSLCSERMRDWQNKFSHLGLSCAELTGDTSLREMTKVRNASIIVTTPEKWDSITRKWADYGKLLQLVKLFLIDEVHILKDIRGATLEAVVSRMKSIGANVRFVALSATVPNSDDIAIWLGKDHTNKHIPAHRETFGEDFRPVKLQKHVYGFEGNFNDFVFEKVLDGKLSTLIKKHTHKKPMMVFYRSWEAPQRVPTIGHIELQEMVACGVAFHHAGLEQQDRNAIESGFLKGDISVICCTSTLAVGVNFPCHLVVLKGTVCFHDNGLGEYSDLEVIQMLGRAGRPQFDDSAVAIIMTRNDKVEKYKKMIAGQDILESTLHLNLIEHLNSEIGLNTIGDLSSAKKWLSGTFLSVRMTQNPDYYKLEGVASNTDVDERLEQVCERDIRLLQGARLVVDSPKFFCTEYGLAMSRYMVQFETMKLLLSVPPQAKMEEILHVLCQAMEFKDLRIKPNERPCLRELNKSPFIKYPIKEAISTTTHKISLMVQVQLGGVEFPISKDFIGLRRHFMSEQGIILERIQRLIRCVIDCKSFDCDSISTQHALDLARSLSARFWEYSSLELRQVPLIGSVAVQKLTSNNINSIEKFANLDTGSIERILSRNPPFGKKTQDVLTTFPRLTLISEIVGRAKSKPGVPPTVNVRAHLGYTNSQVPVWHSIVPSLTFMAETADGTLVHFWRGSIRKLENGMQLEFVAELKSPEDKIKCIVACDEIVGTVQTSVLKHNISVSEFPASKVKTDAKPLPREIKAKRDDPDEFGGNDIGDDDMVAAVMDAEGQTSDYGSDGFGDFADIDSFDIEKRETETIKSVQMENGKWACNHPCRAGQTLKNGQQCKHRCCHKGLDKPPKARKSSVQNYQKESKTKTQNEDTKQRTLSGSIQGSKFNHNAKKFKFVEDLKSKLAVAKQSNANSSDIEYIVLAEELSPVSYTNMAPREHRKLHTLHTDIREDKSTRLPQTKPRFSYGSGKESNLPFLQSKPTNGLRTKSPDPFCSDMDLSDTEDFPSPSTLLKKEHNITDPYLGSTTAHEKSTSTSSSADNSYPNLEAITYELEEPKILPPKPTTPQLDSSSARAISDFSTFPDDNRIEEHFSSPLMSEYRKRALVISDSPEMTSVKHRRLTKDEVAETKEQVSDVSEVPKWVDEFDLDFVEGLKGIVDFVD
ncbi:hypothetical protein B7494_g4813 [Chlorociboria aeruginascens]|nr:hypothetical protein B7494_g4813 [Chlorociboria aeruginascens]